MSSGCGQGVFGAQDVADDGEGFAGDVALRTRRVVFLLPPVACRRWAKSRVRASWIRRLFAMVHNALFAARCPWPWKSPR